MKKTETRKIAEKIQKITGQTLIKINYDAFQFVNMGLCKDRLEALQHILEINQ